MKQLEMRRKDRQKDEKFALEVVDSSQFANISMYDGKEPYTVVISHVRKGESIYFHCAKAGRKIDILKENPRVCVSFVSQNIPTYETDNFTTLFKSAIFYGNAVFVTDEDEKKDALKILCEKYLPEYMENFDSAMKRSFAVTQIIRIDFESFSAKEKRGKVGE
ncbi:pyridoxamine 5'-phosphate oxidase [Peptostreptococcaceae bacterium AS15]|nr:pyridoxamine 5'-phosphate oxidase [Peptostreptococcaceae bacterium AS15]